MGLSEGSGGAEGGAALSPVYGPVPSWRFGRSLGVDLLLRTSICSFNCVYCQLGDIVDVRIAQDVFVPTEEVAAALARVDWTGVDVVTLSGSGEPTLALNIGDVIAHIKDTYRKPVNVLTNSTWLHDAATRARLRRADTVACKLDAPDDAVLAKVNRPVAGVTLEQIVSGICALRVEFPGTLALQVMLMPMNRHIGGALAELIATICPDEVELNTPARLRPRSYYAPCRGFHGTDLPVPHAELRTLDEPELRAIGEVIAARNPGVRVVNYYDRHSGGAE